MAEPSGAAADAPVELDTMPGDDAETARYQGRRRRQDRLPGRVRAAGWLTLLGVALIVALLLIAVPRLFTATEGRQSLLPPAPDTSAFTDGPTNGDAPPSAGASTGPSASANPSRRPSAKPSTSAGGQPPSTAGPNPLTPSTDPTGSPTGPPPPQTVRYEAEAAVLVHAVVQTNHSGYTGSGFVDYANEAGGSILWTVTPTRAGSATLRFRFANGTSNGRPMNVVVNDTVVASPVFSGTGDWDSWQALTVTVTLNAGANTVRAVAASASGGPNVDHLEVVS